MTKFEYPIKVLILWGEAIEGKENVRDWLIANGFPELGLFVFALNNQNQSREWLMKNGFPHLMALINGVEGQQNAIKWLEHNGYNTLAKVALSADGDEEAYKWLVEKDKLFAVLAFKIKKVKDNIQLNNDWYYKINPD